MAAEMIHQDLDFKNSKALFNVKTIRFLVLIITSMLFVKGLFMIVLGNIAYWHYYSYAFFYEGAPMGNYVTPSTLSVIVGLALLFTTMFGFCGTMKKSTCMVNLYTLILILLFILKLVAVCMVYTFDKEAVWKAVHIPVWSIHNPKIQCEVDFLQRSLGCCGNYQYTDYMDMDFPKNMSTVIAATSDQDFMQLPTSCCANADDGLCKVISPSGCKSVLLYKMEHNANIIGVLGISVIIVNLLGIIFSLLLARSIRNMKSERVLMSWKIKEQIILGRQDEEMYKNEQAHYVGIHDRLAKMA